MKKAYSYAKVIWYLSYILMQYLSTLYKSGLFLFFSLMKLTIPCIFCIDSEVGRFVGFDFPWLHPWSINLDSVWASTNVHLKRHTECSIEYSTKCSIEYSYCSSKRDHSILFVLSLDFSCLLQIVNNGTKLKFVLTVGGNYEKTNQCIFMFFFYKYGQQVTFCFCFVATKVKNV